MKNKSIQYIGYVFLGFACICAWVYSIMIFFDWKDNKYVGQLEKQDGNILWINDKKDGSVKVYLSEKTKMIGTPLAQPLDTKSLFFIETIEKDDHKTYAKFIKKLTPKPKYD